MPPLTANDLKTRGVAAIEALLATQPEAMISVRGKERFVVMDVAHYHYLRDCELDAALAQSQADMAAGRYVVESVPQHMARLDALLASDGKPAAAAKPARPVRAKPPAGKTSKASKTSKTPKASRTATRRASAA
jgi:hypothetical protein